MTLDPAYFQTAVATQFVDRPKTALWVYDFDRKRIIWANCAGLKVWQTETLDELLNRDLSTNMSRTVAQLLAQYRDDFIARDDATFVELWTLYPNDAPVAMQVILRGFRLPDNHMAMLCEGIETEAVPPEILRSADALRHTSAMISLFRTNGELLYRNPASRIAYSATASRLGDQFAENTDRKALEADLCNRAPPKRIAQMKTSDGARWHEITARRCKDPVTGDDSILISEVDISDVKAAEQRVRDFADVSSDLFWEMDSKLRFTYLSECVTKLAGVNIEVTLGKSRSYLNAHRDETWRKHLDDLEHRRPFRDF